ncbi:MAG: RsmD family RNA methyltransferase [Solirubrobacterales bacterium]|nr:RsmD family RNA methyltransferase [Solirubrobacterales bacterium]
MRVIGGDLGGRQLLAPKGWKVRPTPERVREAIFSALGDISGMRVADLYCGTGALGIEALSRGAAHATLVDRDTRPATGNVINLGLADRAELVRGEAPTWLASSTGRFDLVFADPPYRLDPAEAARLDRVLPGVLAPDGRVILECEARRPLGFPSLDAVRERRYGRTLVTFFRSIEPDSSR